MFAAVLGLAGISGVVHSLAKDHDVGARRSAFRAVGSGWRLTEVRTCRRRGVGRHAGPVGVLPVRDREQAGPEGCDRRGEEGGAARPEKTDVRQTFSISLRCAVRRLRSLTRGGVPAQGDASPVTAAAGCLCTRNRPNGSFVLNPLHSQVAIVIKLPLGSYDGRAHSSPLRCLAFCRPRSRTRAGSLT